MFKVGDKVVFNSRCLEKESYVNLVGRVGVVTRVSPSLVNPEESLLLVEFDGRARELYAYRVDLLSAGCIMENK